jgi:hypothetical protein
LWFFSFWILKIYFNLIFCMWLISISFVHTYCFKYLIVRKTAKVIRYFFFQ